MSAPRVIAVGEELPPLHRDPGKAHPRSRAVRPDDNARSRSAQRFAVLNAFVDGSMAPLTRAELAVWLVLFRDCRDGFAEVAQQDIARRAGCDRRTVGRALRGLMSRKLIEVIRRGGLTVGPSRYRIHGTPASLVNETLASH